MKFGFLFRDKAARRREEEELNPCKKICALDMDTRLCTGCRRSAKEIANWSSLSLRERRAIVRELPNR
ncbi:DUF1289 domain-containing protein [Lichenifustis flavocetrariae]|nr:DUF1289 domain-containing protein [Lichenifustis flavocetrariae]